ncbi:MAG: sigma-54-dependent Fis family transcriptional regulator [Bdellovibrionales bacterium]|nr:sigma-54-dependent Fis family transcriptional regulator [Bdellovibrionales bacterium]
MKQRIAIVEDADTLREVLATLLESEGYAVDVFSSAEQALPALLRKEIDCIVSDFKLPEKNGIELLTELRKGGQRAPFLIMTAFGSIEIAVEAMKEGANDFITKPFEPSDLTSMLRELIEHRRIIHRNLGKETKRPRRYLTHDQKTNKVVSQAKKVARVDTSVLILGESGTGKELIARMIHENSPRSEKPFIAVNCAAMPEALLESEFFGHEAGAFTGATETRVGVFEYASEGTIFLDEVGDMPYPLQVKLLRALQEREIKRVGGTKIIKANPRVIAATHVDVPAALDAGRLREDFYYRIAVVTLRLPPLRERPNDVEELARYFVDYFSSVMGKEGITFSKEALRLMKKYTWPGNVRELENCIERAMILAGQVVEPEHLGIKLGLDIESIEQATKTLPEVVQEATRAAEIQVINRILAQTDGNKTQAAKILGVSYKTLLNKLKEYQLQEGSPS